MRARFWRTHDITLIYGDSRVGCVTLRNDVGRRTLFFYLDAHWNDDLPLAEEIEIVFSRCPLAAIMIDDFQVPLDPGYGYDDYGAGRALIPSYIASPITTYNLQAFYPATPSAEESSLHRAVSFSRDRLLQRRP